MIKGTLLLSIRILLVIVTVLTLITLVVYLRDMRLAIELCDRVSISV